MSLLLLLMISIPFCAVMSYAMTIRYQRSGVIFSLNVSLPCILARVIEEAPRLSIPCQAGAPGLEWAKDRTSNRCAWSASPSVATPETNSTNRYLSPCFEQAALPSARYNDSFIIWGRLLLCRPMGAPRVPYMSSHARGGHIAMFQQLIPGFPSPLHFLRCLLLACLQIRQLVETPNDCCQLLNLATTALKKTIHIMSMNPPL
ncbi:hypothetical protein BDV23DRAFT_155514 [Aspergillus alliaceus]|uniref:Secreted protein n=1 Tax=Petromyces alliaceus TaxID=209559 RepID=A0A5N7C848_PETAA|nr:hypothetical protein BDV23DRAFT_155514 [Aspergillus alliaceus]